MKFDQEINDRTPYAKFMKFKNFLTLFPPILFAVGAATLITPVEMVRTKMQSERLSYSQVGVALRHSLKEGGVKSLMLGLGPTLLRDLPFSGVKFEFILAYKLPVLKVVLI